MRPRTPTKILELRGSFKKDPQRKRHNEPQGCGEVGKAPEYFTDVEKAIWDEIVTTSPPGVITGTDAHNVELCAVLLAQFRADRVNFAPTRMAQLVRLMSLLGRTPSDRSKLSVPEQRKTDDPWAALAGEA